MMWMSILPGWRQMLDGAKAYEGTSDQLQEDQ